jgi:hypothetical protein
VGKVDVVSGENETVFVLGINKEDEKNIFSVSFSADTLDLFLRDVITERHKKLLIFPNFEIVVDLFEVIITESHRIVELAHFALVAIRCSKNNHEKYHKHRSLALNSRFFPHFI